MNGEVLCEDSVLSGNNHYAFSLLDRSCLVGLVHCEVKDNALGVFSSYHPTDCDDDDDEDEESHIFTLNCSGDEQSLAEIKRYGWEGRTSSGKKRKLEE